MDLAAENVKSATTTTMGEALPAKPIVMQPSKGSTVLSELGNKNGGYSLIATQSKASWSRSRDRCQRVANSIDHLANGCQPIVCRRREGRHRPYKAMLWREERNTRDTLDTETQHTEHTGDTGHT